MSGTPFQLPSAWLTAGIHGSRRHCVNLSIKDLVVRLEVLGQSTAAELNDVLFAAHTKVLALLNEEVVFTTQILRPGQPRPRTVAAAPGLASSWRELIDQTRRSLRDALPNDPAQQDEGQALFTIGGAADCALDPQSSRVTGLWVEVATDALLIGSDGQLDAAALDRVAAVYRNVLEAMAATPDGSSHVAVLPAAERRAVLEKWACGLRLDRGSVTVLDLFLRSAAATPDAAAARADGRVLTFRQLDNLSTRIAWRLIERGAHPGSAVGVCMRRCSGLLPTLLAAWKTGAFYLPLDVDLPPTRLHRMALASDCRLIVSAKEHCALLDEAFAEATHVFLDQESLDTAEPPDILLPTGLNPAALAYVMFTSGSTGSPKGVMVHHRGLANYVQWAAENYAARGTGGSPYLSSIGFDLGMASLLAPLAVGQRVDLLPDPLDLTDVGALLVEGGPYSFVKLTPGHLNLLSTDLDGTQARDLAGLVIAAGDAFPTSLARRWRALAGPLGARVATEYGPTEITVGNSGQEVTDTRGDRLIPLGVPIPNTTMYVLDDFLAPAPIGVSGEVCVGGAGVAHGYLGAPSLTAERFVPDPYGHAGARLYRTGDLGYWNEKGELAFVGRADHQVKIRGYRVEPDEVRSVLQRSRGVQEATVLARFKQPGVRLAAFVVPVPGIQVDPLTLRADLLAQLPDYMVPESVSLVTRIPLTANGKVDSEALLAELAPGAQPVPALPSTPSRKQPPVTATDADTYQVVVNDEEQYSIWDTQRDIPSGWRATGFLGEKAQCLEHIAEIWTDLRPLSARTDSTPAASGKSDPEVASAELEQSIAGFMRELIEAPSLGVSDDFMAHGGTSMLAARLLWRVQVAHDVEIAMRVFFDAPTARDLAREVERLQTELMRSEI